jgi:hypothetical protein
MGGVMSYQTIWDFSGAHFRSNRVGHDERFVICVMESRVGDWGSSKDVTAESAHW